MANKYTKTAEAVAKLNKMQFEVTQRCGTEPAFNNAFWDHKEEGLYVDVVSGAPLFSSHAKYDSHSGWPSFTRPVDDHCITEHQDTTHGMVRTEVRSRHAGSHLGHVFSDGPADKGGRRYCINSASLRFIPRDRLQEEGYAAYTSLFDDQDKAVTHHDKREERAMLAGGCFWGMQDLFRTQPGIISTRVGYTGGHTAHPDYATVKQGHTGHAEAIEIIFDPQQISYRQLLIFFFTIHDATTKNRQGNDIGASYRSAIFFTSAAQEKIACQLIAEMEASRILPGRITTEVVAASVFWEAEKEHQDYLQRNPGGYTCHWVRPQWNLESQKQ